MKIYNDVQSAIKPKPFEINDYKVIITQSVEQKEIQSQFEEETTLVFFYTQIEYDKDEYIAILKEQNESLKQEITDMQLALCDLYETGDLL